MHLEIGSVSPLLLISKASYHGVSNDDLLLQTGTTILTKKDEDFFRDAGNNESFKYTFVNNTESFIDVYWIDNLGVYMFLEKISDFVLSKCWLTFVVARDVNTH